MKRIIQHITIIGIAVSGTLYSCNDWFDVDASTKITQEKLFSTPDGYHTAVNGVYRILSSPELYGKQLIWGLASVLGQNYQNNYLPYDYRLILSGDLESSRVRNIIDPIWTTGYKVIANCNNIIAHTESKDPSFFQLGQTEKDVILGEMYGIRALMHFQMLQLFAPTPAQDDGKLYMPYVTKYPEHQPEHLTVPEVMKKVIEDMELARTKLAYHDTIFNTYGINSVSSRFEGLNAYQEGGLFFGLRGTRMNYVAATALLARIYLWNGDKVNALACAKNAYHFFTYSTPSGTTSTKRWFYYTSIYTSDPKDVSRKLHDDIILAFYNANEYDIYLEGLDTYSNYIYKNVNEIFQRQFSTSQLPAKALESDDYRYSKLIETDNTSRKWQYPVPTGPYDYTPINVINYQGPLLPVIRMSEMAHIICECDQTAGLRPIMLLRYYRGMQTSATVPDDQQFWPTVMNDVVRENMSEGRTFFFFKRLNLPVFNGVNPVDMSNLFKIPLPHSETAYSNL